MSMRDLISSIVDIVLDGGQKTDMVIIDDKKDRDYSPRSFGFVLPASLETFEFTQICYPLEREAIIFGRHINPTRELFGTSRLF
jgi:hypothetical protein